MKKPQDDVEMNAFDIFSGFIPLIVLGLLGYGLLRLARRAHGARPADPAVVTRQVVTYGLLYVAMVLSAVGTTMIVDQLGTSRARLDNTELAGSLALVALGVPVFSVLLAFVDRRLERDPSERSSTAWSAYLTLASLTALIGTMVGSYQIISSTIDTSPWRDLEFRSVVMVVSWGSFFLVHWVFLRLRHGIRGDLHLAAGSLLGLVTLGIGQAGLLVVLANRMYNNAFGQPTSDLGNKSASWAGLFLVGAAVWLGIWLRQYESAERTQAWYVTVLPFGALVGFVALLATAARTAYLILVWFIGETRSVEAVEHFDNVPALAGVGATGLISWLYHRALVNEETTRSSAVRSYDYLLMGGSLISGAIGAVLIISSLLDDGSTDQNLALSGITLFVAGGFTWSRFASHVVSHQVGVDGLVELGSPVRRSYLYSTIGVGAFTVLLAGINTLGGFFEDVLDGVLSTGTVVDQREQLAAVVIAGGVLWFHAIVLRRDLQRLGISRLPEPNAHWPSRIIVVGAAAGNPLVLDGHPDTSIEYWHRTDGVSAGRTRPIELDALEDVLGAQSGDDVLILLTGDNPVVIPFERELDIAGG